MDVALLPLDKASVVEAVVEFALGFGEGARVVMALLCGLQVVVDLRLEVLLLGVDGNEDVGRLGEEPVVGGEACIGVGRQAEDAVGSVVDVDHLRLDVDGVEGGGVVDGGVIVEWSDAGVAGGEDVGGLGPDVGRGLEGRGECARGLVRPDHVVRRRGRLPRRRVVVFDARRRVERQHVH